MEKYKIKKTQKVRFTEKSPRIYTIPEEDRKQDLDNVYTLLREEVDLTLKYRNTIDIKIYHKYIMNTLKFLNEVVSLGESANSQVKISHHRILDIHLFKDENNLVSLYTFCKESYPYYSSHTKWHYFSNLKKWTKVLKGYETIEWQQI